MYTQYEHQCGALFLWNILYTHAFKKVNKQVLYKEK